MAGYPSIGQATSIGPLAQVAEAGIPTNSLAGAAKAVSSLSPELQAAFKSEMFKRYITKMFANPPGTNPAPMASAAGQVGQKLSGILPAFSLFGGGAEDIELPNESGVRDERLGAPSLLDTLKMSRAAAKRLLGTETR